MAPAPEVDFVLSAINDDWPGGEASLADVPLERIDRDNADNLDGTWTHLTSEDPEEMNFVGAASGPWTDRPIDPQYNVETTRIVSLKLEGMHVSEYGAIDPDAGTADAASRSHPTTTWDDLKSNVREALYQDANRKSPSVSGRSGVGFKDLFIDQWDDQSRNFADYYVLFAELRLVGFENLPT